jgi:hypothetical protein
MIIEACITAGLRAFSPSFPLTQRHAVYVHTSRLTFGRSGVTG